MPKALLLDLDGTIADTDALHMPLWMDLLGSHGVEVDEEFYKHRISGRLNPDIPCPMSQRRKLGALFTLKK